MDLIMQEIWSCWAFDIFPQVNAYSMHSDTHNKILSQYRLTNETKKKIAYFCL